jgi:hypothetical protein
MSNRVGTASEVIMKRAAPHHGIFLLAGTLLVLASIAWAAPARPRSSAPRAASTAKKSVARAQVARRHVAATASKSPVATKRVAPAPAGQAGMRIFRDPETGEIGPPTAENARAISLESLGRPSVDVSQLKQTQLSDGRGWMIETSGIEDALVMQIDKNGNRVMKCVTDQKAAHQHVTKGPVAPVREDR